jgi:Flp pilus assembly protein TadD
MTQESKELRPGISVSSDFLLSKAHAKAKPTCSPTVEPDENGDLLSAYPHLLKGKSLMIRAMNHLEEITNFGAVVVEIDGVQSEAHSGCDIVSRDIQLKVARALDTICQSANGLWGLLDNAAFGCFFPDCNQNNTEEMALRIKSALTSDCHRTVTIGIAVFPTLEYAKDQILDNARKALDHAKFFGPDSMVCFDAISLNISGDKLYDAGYYQNAIDEFNTALLFKVKDANLHNSLGVCYGVTGEFREALDQFASAIDLDPNEPLAHYNAALVHLILGEREEAACHLREADQGPHNLPEVALQLGKLYLEDNELDKSRRYLETAENLDPHSPLVSALLGECFAALGLTKDAIANYKKALRLNANDAVSLSGLGWLYHQMDKNADIAKSFCRHSTEIAPQNGLYRHRLGIILYKEGRFKEAKQAFQSAIELGYDKSTRFLEKVESRLLDKAS